MENKLTIAEKFGFKTKLDADTQERLYNCFKSYPNKNMDNAFETMWKFHESQKNSGVYARFFKNLHFFAK